MVSGKCLNNVTFFFLAKFYSYVPISKSQNCTKNGRHDIHVRFYASLPLMAMWSYTAEPLGGINSWWKGGAEGGGGAAEKARDMFVSNTRGLFPLTAPGQ